MKPKEFFEINKTDKTLASGSGRKRKKTQIKSTKNESHHYRF